MTPCSNPSNNRILQSPREHILALQEAVKETAANSDPSVAKLLKTNDLQVGFEGSVGRNAVSPRGLLSNLLNQLVEIEGIVTKCSSVKPKVVRSVHFCEETGQYLTREHRDNMGLDIGIEIRQRMRLPTTSTFPTQNAEGQKLEMETGLSQYKDVQTITLQEMPERAKVGQLPRSIEVVLEHDLVDRVKPGDRIKCIGVYMPIAPSAGSGSISGEFKTVVLCNNISIVGKDIGSVHLTGVDVRNIREVAASRPHILETIARSFCPSIFGHDFIKKALVLQLLGGNERNLENGTHLRGDINIMMVGDPSTAKSQLLRSVLDIAPLAISTTGRGSSGVGLTAAVTTDVESGERRLEAGAMVLADRGVVCIDEFDKMSENDRVAIHEVMEQQTVTIAKAGIHASLNARCSVVAAANPVYGQYDRTRRPQDNIGLPDSLLSRFDLLFIVLDQIDPTLDRILSEHVIRSHQYRRPGTIMEPEPLNQGATLCLDEDEVAETAVWQRGGRGSESSTGNGAAGDVFTKEFLRKYIHYAKNRIKPELSDEAMECISSAYANMRSRAMGPNAKKNLPVTARSLETIIRLSTASAKARLSKNVEEIDVDQAMELLNFVLFHEIGTAEEGLPVNGSGGSSSSSSSSSSSHNNGNKRGAASGRDALEGQTSGDDDDDDNNDGNASNKRSRRTSSSSSSSSSSYPMTGVDDDDDYDDDDERVQIRQDNARKMKVDTNSAPYRTLREHISKLNQQDGTEQIEFRDLYFRLRTLPATSQSTRMEVEAILFELERENKIMFQDQNIYIL